MTALVSTNPVSMTSREIAELTGKRHDNVLRDIRAMLSQAYDLQDSSTLRNPEISGVSVFQDPQTKRVSEIHLDKDHTLTLLTGYDAKARLAVIKRWQELEGQQAFQAPAIFDPRPRQAAAAVLENELNVAALLGVPLHVAQLEAVKTVSRETGVDYRHLLALAPAQSTVAPDDVMLEPSDIATRFGIKDGASVNTWLEQCGLQTKEGKTWVATERGKPYCAIHQWSTMFKSGYNLKWSAACIRSLLPANWPIPDEMKA